ncbi:MAG: MFS transporter [Cyclobacteriaceae bacterium]
MNEKKSVLILIVLAQFCCTTLWFAPNGVAEGMALSFGMENIVSSVTSSVQFGFITGTLLFAFLKLADRFSPSAVFLICAILGAATSGLITQITNPLFILPLRFATGFFLAGIYPVGMKIASDYHQKGLGVALGYLVGALVIGTAFPHLLKNLFADFPWQNVVLTASGLALLGGLIIGLGVKDGPYQKRSTQFEPSAFITIFNIPKFRGAAVGYFGHMWELYAFWAFLPLYITLFSANSQTGLSVSSLTFSVIAIGGLGCVVGGYLSKKAGSKKVASLALMVSLACCIISPFALTFPTSVFLVFLFVWGMAVIMDSPQFSTLVAAAAPPDLVGTGLTIVNSIGFGITILSISILGWITPSEWLFLWLAPGPLIGLLYFKEYG